MNDIDKEIEEIHEIIAQDCGTFDNPPHCDECEYVGDEYPYPYCRQWLKAEILYKAGYRKMCPNAITNELGDIICGNDKSENLADFCRIEEYKKEIERLKEEIMNNFISKQAIITGIGNKEGTKLLLTANRVIDEAKQEAIKEFSEKLKTKFDEQKHFYEVAEISHRDISLVALNTAYKMLNDLLKEYGIDTEEKQ